jgi:hypothetical protein
VCRDDAHDVLAIARGRYGAYPVLRIGTGPNQRRVADATRKLSGDPAGGRGRCEVSVTIKGNRADRSLGGQVLTFGPLLKPVRELLLGDVVALIHEFELAPTREALSARPDE